MEDLKSAKNGKTLLKKACFIKTENIPFHRPPPCISGLDDHEIAHPLRQNRMNES